MLRGRRSTSEVGEQAGKLLVRQVDEPLGSVQLETPQQAKSELGPRRCVHNAALAIRTMPFAVILAFFHSILSKINILVTQV
jgi:hypothetical protein